MHLSTEDPRRARASRYFSHEELFEYEHEFRPRALPESTIDLRIKITHVFKKHTFVARNEWIELPDSGRKHVEAYVGGAHLKLTDVQQLEPGTAFIVRDVEHSADTLFQFLRFLAQRCPVRPEATPAPKRKPAPPPSAEPEPETPKSASANEKESMLAAVGRGLVSSGCACLLALAYAHNLLEAGAIAATAIVALERLRGTKL